MLIAFATAKVVLEKENNDKADTPEEIPAPCEVAGRIDKRQDRDWYVFNAKKGDIFMVELFSDRLGVPADLFFTFKKEKATNEVEEDDNPDIMQTQQYFNRTSDPRPYRFAATRRRTLPDRRRQPRVELLVRPAHRLSPARHPGDSRLPADRHALDDLLAGHDRALSGRTPIPRCVRLPQRWFYRPDYSDGRRPAARRYLPADRSEHRHEAGHARLDRCRQCGRIQRSIHGQRLGRHQWQAGGPRSTLGDNHLGRAGQSRISRRSLVSIKAFTWPCATSRSSR